MSSLQMPGKNQYNHIQSIHASESSASGKKAQMEILGLAIIVVLLIMGVLFAVRIALLNNTEEYRSDYLNTQLAANTLNTLLLTTTECRGLQVKELLQDAAKAQPSITCSGMPSKSFVQSVTQNILGATLGQELKKQYYLKAVVQNAIVISAGSEKQDSERERKSYFLPTDAGVMTITLDVYK